MKQKYIIEGGVKISLKNDINGVVYNKYSNKYMVNIELKNKTKALGIADTLEEGIELYLKACKKYKSAKIIKIYEQQSLFH
ncbi:hypothetical protein [uncultured Cetobacterium sp.]|uniref:hypothetical protein n=1 Tax=uncultured Cetobacterium sp. TaxID=527638 RepID=UPI00260A446E|nr:hypothetical protein [uncultured Cetobacterium sp.]